MRLRLKPAAWADQQYSVVHDFQKTQLQQCTVKCQCDYNVSIRVLQQYVKTQHQGNFTTSDLYYTTGFHSWENPACITLLGVRGFNFMT